MLNHLIRRLLSTFLPTMLGISILIFFAIYMIPGPYVNIPLGTTADETPEQIEQTNRAYWLDKPLPVQFMIWMGNVLRGNLGESLRSNRNRRS